ncbi:uncharacterized protein [Asterias amurensis]|uniref:uncharacterized protein n=1 Tax=Asterias amurensis TaxID=7602 RepID=UPI003AB57249
MTVLRSPRSSEWPVALDFFSCLSSIRWIIHYLNVREDESGMSIVVLGVSSNMLTSRPNTCRTSYMFLRRIAAIRHLLTTSAAEQLIHAFITSRLDFCNSLLAGLPKNTLHRLQSVQNAAARLLTGTKISSHISPILHNLQWLPIHSRIQYKIILLTFKALHGLSPTYIQNMIRPRSARPGLRSSGSMLYVPLTRLSSYGDRAFSNISPRL